MYYISAFALLRNTISIFYFDEMITIMLLE